MSAAEFSFSRGGFSRCHDLVVRVVVAVTLLVASAFKSWFPQESDLNHTLGEGLRWSLVAMEVVLAVWLLSGRLSRFARLADVAFFLGFAAISLFKAAAGAVSCGCFGGVATNPWLTACFDLSVVVALGADDFRTRKSGSSPRRWLSGCVMAL